MVDSGGPATNDPRSLGNQPATAVPGGNAPGTYAPGGTPPPAGTTTPSGTAYPSGTPLEAARQRALRGPAGTAIPPSAAGVGAGGEDAATQAATPGLPNSADPNRSATMSGDLSRLGGGRPRKGATGRSLAECEAAWDSGTHMSRETWRTTCLRTLNERP